MSFKDLIFGRGVKAILPDASPEEISALTIEFNANPNASVKVPIAVDSGETVVKTETDPFRVAAQAAYDRYFMAVNNPNKMGLDAAGKPATAKELRIQLDSFLGDSKEEKKEMAEDKKEEMAEDKKEMAGDTVEDLADSAADAHPKDCDCTTCGKMAKDKEEKKEMAEDAGKEIDDGGQSVLKAANDSMVDYVKITKPIIAVIALKAKNKRSKVEQLALDSYNSAVRALNNSGGKVYSALATQRVPEGVAVDSDPGGLVESDKIAGFYEGVPYKTGKARHEAYINQKGSK